jgi:hypothetical protein
VTKANEIRDLNWDLGLFEVTIKGGGMIKRGVVGNPQIQA